MPLTPDISNLFQAMSILKDTLKAFDDFKNKQNTAGNNIFLIRKSMYILKVYSIHSILR